MSTESARRRSVETGTCTAERAATMLQPEQNRAEHSRIRSRTEIPKTAQISRISQQDRTQKENPNLTYKEGAAGSNPASPTIKIAVFAGKKR